MVLVSSVRQSPAMLSFSPLLLLLLLAAVDGVIPPVVRFDSDMDGVVQLLWKLHRLGKHESMGWKVNSNLRLKAFSWTNCGNSTSKFVLQNLVISPDPIKLPGSVTFAFKCSILDNFPSGLETNVTIKSKIGSQWITLPCIGDIGSCYYPDICDILAGISECPEPFIENRVPCKCPFNKGSYTLPSSEFDIGTALFPPGDYQAKISMMHAGEFVGCYKVYLSFAN